MLAELFAPVRAEALGVRTTVGTIRPPIRGLAWSIDPLGQPVARRVMYPIDDQLYPGLHAPLLGALITVIEALHGR